MRAMNVGIIGTGDIAAVMAKTLKYTKHAKLYAVASRGSEKAAAFARQYGARKAYGSYEELVKDPKVQLIYIATPHSEHYANAKMCLLAGKPVLCEKAFTVNAAQAEELVKIAQDNKVFLAEAMWVRYMPFFATIKSVLDSKIIGEPVQLTANLGYNIRSKARMTDPYLAGGALLDVGVYPLTFASMVFGEDILRMHATCTYTSKHLDEQDAISIIYRDGRMANITASMIGISDRKGIIYGTKGYLIVENINNFESLTAYDNTGKKIAFYKRPKQKTGYEYEVEAAVRAIRAGKIECEEMPHAQTLSIMHMLDFIRSQMGIVYPFEKGEVQERERTDVPTPQKETANESAPALTDAILKETTDALQQEEIGLTDAAPVTEFESAGSEETVPLTSELTSEVVLPDDTASENTAAQSEAEAPEGNTASESEDFTAEETADAPVAEVAASEEAASKHLLNLHLDWKK